MARFDRLYLIKKGLVSVDLNIGAMAAGRRFCTVRETARDLSLPEHSIRRMVRGGTCPGFYSGTRFYVDTVALLEKLADLSAQRGAVDIGNGG